jgi:hypothetical protein
MFYGCIAFDRMADTLILQVERIQDQSLRIVLGRMQFQNHPLLKKLSSMARLDALISEPRIQEEIKTRINSVNRDNAVL